jgi:hypothetical protein
MSPCDAGRSGCCQNGTAVGWAFWYDMTVLNDDLRAEKLEPFVIATSDGMCVLALAKKVFKHTKRTTKNFSQSEIGVMLGITDATLKEHVDDDDAVLGSRIFAELLRIAKDDLRVVYMAEKKKIHGSWGTCLRAGFRTPVEGKRDRWAD